MNIEQRVESREQCTEAGWYAYDYLFDRTVGRTEIERLRAFGGDLLYLSSLREPFYKLEDSRFMIRGIEGTREMRLAVYRENEQVILEKFEKFCRDCL